MFAVHTFPFVMFKSRESRHNSTISLVLNKNSGKPLSAQLSMMSSAPAKPVIQSETRLEEDEGESKQNPEVYPELQDIYPDADNISQTSKHSIKSRSSSSSVPRSQVDRLRDRLLDVMHSGLIEQKAEIRSEMEIMNEQLVRSIDMLMRTVQSTNNRIDDVATSVRELVIQAESVVPPEPALDFTTYLQQQGVPATRSGKRKGRSNKPLQTSLHVHTAAPTTQPSAPPPRPNPVPVPIPARSRSDTTVPRPVPPPRPAQPAPKRVPAVPAPPNPPGGGGGSDDSPSDLSEPDSGHDSESSSSKRSDDGDRSVRGRRFARASLGGRPAQASGKDQIQIHYIQKEPDEFSFRLNKMTVNSAVAFLEMYNRLLKQYPNVPPVSRFLSLNVQEEIIANARSRKQDVNYLLYEGIQSLSDRKILSMIHHTVKDTYVTDPAAFARHLREVKFPEDGGLRAEQLQLQETAY